MKPFNIQTSLFTILFFLEGCSDRSEVAKIPEPPKMRTITSDIEDMFVLHDIDGDVDIEGVLEAFYHLNSTATKSDLPILLRAIKSPRNNFWTRELLSEPIARLGEVSVLESLLNAFHINERDGHDNDGFSAHLSYLVALEPQTSYKELIRLKNDPNFKHEELCDWLLEYIGAEDEKSSVSPIQYSSGDSFQGMWNYDKRNANLRLTVESVYISTRLLLVSLQSDDLDNVKKEFIGKVGDNGRHISLRGLARSGSDYEVVSGYSVRDFLREGSTIEIELNDFSAQKLRGKVENGTNVYFWSNPSWKPAK